MGLSRAWLDPQFSILPTCFDGRRKHLGNHLWKLISNVLDESRNSTVGVASYFLWIHPRQH